MPRKKKLNGILRKKLMWTPLALNDRNELFYAHADRDEAIFTDEAIDEAAEKLVTRTDTGFPGRVGGTMETGISGEFVLVYDATDSQIRILRILSGELPE